MSESFIDKEVTVKFEIRETVSYSGTVVADDERGITLRRPYRKGVRLELVPRDSIRGVYHTEEKGHKRSRLASDGEPETETEDLENDEGFGDDDDGFEDEPDTDFDEDDEDE